MQRSGQHVIIDWLCRGLGQTVHFNHCWSRRVGAGYVLTPGRGRRVVYEKGAPVSDTFVEGDVTVGLTRHFNALVYSFEDYRYNAPDLSRVRRGTQSIIIVRDHYNWLASTLRHGRTDDAAMVRKVQAYRALMEQVIGGGQPVIHYNRFVLDPAYRMEQAAALRLPDAVAAETALGNVPDFGGGSSFGGRRPAGDVLGRWRAYADDPRFRRLASDPELVRLTHAVCAPFEGYDDILATLGLIPPC